MKRNIIVFIFIVLSIFTMSLFTACDKDNVIDGGKINDNVNVPQINTYTYTFYDEDGTTVIKTETVNDGSAIVAPDAPQKSATAQYTYTFSGWDKAIPETITADITFTAAFSSVVNQYGITAASDITGVGTFDYGAEITVVFTDEIPADKRVEWKNGDNVLGYSETAQFVFTVHGNVALVATLVERESTEGLIFTASGESYIVWGYTGSSPEIFISSVYQGLPVVGIRYDSFRGNTAITSIRIPKSATQISDSAFYGCSGLTSIIVEDGNIRYYTVNNCLIDRAGKELIRGCSASIIPSDGSVVEIKSCSFYGDTSLKSITIPNCITEIGDSAFAYTGLTSVSIPENVTTIGNGLFNGCSDLISVNLPSNLTRIGFRMFYECTKLESIDIPSGVTIIEQRAFYRCFGLTSVTIPESVETIETYAFCNCTSLEEVTIPGGLTVIADAVFCNCSSLTSIIIPNGVTYINSGAFAGCVGLTSVTIPESVEIIGSQAFQSCENYTVIIDSEDIASSIIEVGDCGLLIYKFSVPVVYIKDTITAVGTYITDNYTITATDKAGYVKYIANS